MLLGYVDPQATRLDFAGFRAVLSGFAILAQGFVLARDVQRRLSAILAADVVGYSRLMGEDETGTLEALRQHRRELLTPNISKHGGRIVKLMGDGALVEFASAVEAVACAVDIQILMQARNRHVAEHRRIVFRIGINIGDVILDGDDIFGDGVNVAARLEGLADPGGICISRNVRNQVRDKLPLTLQDRGETEIKNIARPVRVFAVALDEHAEALATAATAVPAPRRSVRGVALLIGSALGAVALGVGGWQLLAPTFAPGPAVTVSPAQGRPSIAVLPFDNLSDDPDQDYFADGLTDDLITDLSKISGLFVIARNSVFAYKDRTDDVRAVADELGVRYVLDGSVRRAGNALRINAQLIDGATGDNLWAERYDSDRADIFAIQDEVIASIVDALAVKLTDTERNDVARLPTDSLEAYDYYLRGERLTYNAERRSVDQALRLYQRAIAIDPEFADAYAGYARVAVDVLSYSFADTLPSAVARQRAYEAASRALALDPRLARSYSVLALLQMLDGQHDSALASARKAVDLAPNDAEAHLNLAVVQVYAGRKEEALKTMETVLSLNPKPPAQVHDYYALALFMNGRDADALAILQENPAPAKSDLRLEMLASSNARLGRGDAAKAAIDEMLSIFPGTSLEWYRVLLRHHSNDEDQKARLDALALAGLPEWPFGFEGDPARRLDAAAIDELTAGRTWSGDLDRQEPFVEYHQDGGFIHRGADYQFTGSYWIAKDELCLEAPGVVMGREHCGPIYRDPDGAAGGAGTYSYPTAYGLRQFSVDR